MNNNFIKKLPTFVVILLLIGTITIPVFAGNNDLKLDSIKSKFVSNFDIDENITKIMEEAKIPSLSACIIKNNSMVWHNEYGKYNRLWGFKPSKDTVYMAGSISKTITTTALMQLYEKGLFDLDEDVSNHLPFLLRNPNHPELNITFRMLLSHQSSLPVPDNKTFLKLIVRSILFPNIFPYPYIKEHLVPGGCLYTEDVWTENKPGEEFNYSNEGFLILQFLIEQLSNQSFDDYCNENIFKPLKMYNSSFDFRDIKRGQKAVPYILIKNILIRLPFYYIPEKGAGGLLTSVEDLSHFLIAHMNNGTYGDVQILSNSSIELMHSIYYNNSDNSGYGLGWAIFNFSGNRYQGHSGGGPGFAAFMVFNETNKTGVILFFNTNADIIIELLDLLFLKAEEF